jgi:dTDP-4-amino-4,6-dideoxygalactose transaminase
VDIPLLDLKAQFATYRGAAMEAITRVVESQHFIMGPEVAGFEKELARYVGVPHGIGMSSGTDALLAALMVLDVGPGDEVVTTPFSFFATAGVVARLGARPVFVDIDPGTFNVTEAGLRGAITANTKALMPVHLFGQVAELGDLYDDPARPPLIEDAAQSIGASLHGRMSGQLGDFACYSFFPAKNLGCFGDGGGMAVTDDDLAERARIMRLHGSKPKYYHHVVGGNFRLDALQAAVLRVKLPLLDGWAAGRRANAERYVGLFRDSGLVERGLVGLPVVRDGAEHVFNQFVVRVERRDALQAHLGACGIGSAVYYPGPLHLQPCFANLGYGPGDFPEAERACGEVLALPIYPELPEGAQARVVETIKAFYGA